MGVKRRGFFRFVKSAMVTKGGHPISVCHEMRRVKRGDVDFLFRCKECGWRWESEELTPLEVRLHLQLHHPELRWKARWATVPPDKEHCPNCGFSQTSWRIEEPREETA